MSIIKYWFFFRKHFSLNCAVVVVSNKQRIQTIVIEFISSHLLSESVPSIEAEEQGKRKKKASAVNMIFY